MRVVFLDFDGVINNCSTPMQLPPAARVSPGTYAPDFIGIPVDAACMSQLNVLLMRSGAKVVISSSWRKFAAWQHLAPALGYYGFQYSDRIIGETPDLVSNEAEREAWRARDNGPVDGAYEKIERGMEIWYWLQLHPEVTEAVILDDCDDMWIMKDLFVQTRPNDGFTAEDADQVLALFNTGIAARRLDALRAKHGATHRPRLPRT